MNQASKLATYLANGYHGTRLTVMHQLGIANITAVVSDVRAALGNDSIVTIKKRDANGKLYAEYSMPEHKRDHFIFKGISRPDGKGGRVIRL